MKTERIILSFVALLAGLLVAGVAFYLYQTTKIIPSSSRIVSLASPTPPLSTSSIPLSINTPKDEDVTDSKTVTVSGKTSPNAVLIITTSISDQVVTPAGNGDFSATITIENGENLIEIKAIGPNGEEAKVTRTITFSTESF